MVRDFGSGLVVSDEQALRAVGWRRWRPTLLTAIIALAAQACGIASNPQDGTAGRASSGSGGANGGDASLGGGISLGGTTGGTGGQQSCGGEQLFLDESIDGAHVGAQRVFYSWTTDEQVAELRAGGPLFSRSESPGKGRGLALTQLEAFAVSDSGPAQQLAAQLASTVFAKLRYSWTNPWATLLGWPGETYGNQLLQVELKPDAWIAVFDEGRLSVFDVDNQPVELASALDTPERIGAIYFQANVDGSPTYCGSFSQGTVGFREFVLGNLHMVKRWSLATPELKQRLAQDITDLQAFQAEVACLPVPEQPAWSSDVTCQWRYRWQEPEALSNYGFSLGIPSELYWPSVPNIQALIAALQMSMPTGEALDVTPEQ